MINKFKNLSIGKKVYTSFWMFWTVILFVLIGLLTGLNQKMIEKKTINDGWSISLKQARELELLKAGDVTFKNVDDWKNLYYVKDIAATNKYLKQNLSLLKSNILEDVSIKSKINGVVTTNSTLDEIKKAVLALKDGLNPDKAAIEKMYELIFSNTKYKKLSEARTDESFRSKYDLKIGKLDSTLLYPLVINNKIVDRGNVVELGKFQNETTTSAKEAQNIVAAFGFIFLTFTIITVLTTVFVSIKARKEVK